MDKILPEEINVVLTCDERYVRHAACTIISIVKNSRRRYRFYVLDCGIKEESLERLRSWDIGENEIRLIPIKKNEVFENFVLPRSKSFSPAIFYRLMIPEILTDLDKAIYLDSDVIVVGDISELWDTNLGDKFVGVVYEDYIFPSRFWEKRKRQLGIPPEKLYFNNGVLLMNLTALREWNFLGKAIQVLRDKPNLEYPDQDAMNIILDTPHLLTLSPKFNFTVQSVLKKPLKQQPICLHFSWLKPWKMYEIICKYWPSTFGRLYYNYYKYAALTPWKKERQRDASWFSLFRFSWKNTFQPIERFFKTKMHIKNH